MRHKQQGIVIIIALFIVALVATMAYFMMERLQRDTRRTSLIVHNTQAALYAEGSIAWAMDQLRRDSELKRQGQVVDRMPMASPVDEVNGYRIKSTIEDMQGRFNVNNLQNAGLQQDFVRLMMMVSPKLSKDNAESIMKAAVDWINPAAGQNEYSKYYQSLPIPYRAAHRAMVSPSELQLVKGMTPALYTLLSPYITALPEATLINYQTASAPVIATLSDAMTLPAAMAIVTVRAQSMPPTTQAFLDQPVVKNHGVAEGKITDTSSYFLVKTDVEIENQHLLIYTLLQRATKQDKARIAILWRSIGVW